jgi:hypothetical protein
MISPDWVNAIAGSISAVVAASMLYLAWKDRQAKLGARDWSIKPLPEVTFSGPTDETIREFVTTLRARNKAHDEILRVAPFRALGWTFGLLGAWLLALLVIIFFSGHFVVAVIVWTPTSVVTVMAGGITSFEPLTYVGKKSFNKLTLSLNNSSATSALHPS